ncbi:MAG: TonB-dependent receptor, partial [Pseudomonadota bacterium]
MRYGFWCGALTVSGSLVGNIEALAQDESPVQLNEIVVEGEFDDPTGPVDGYRVERSNSAIRLGSPLDELPISIQVLPRDVIEDSNAQRVEDAVLAATGASVGNTFGGIDNRFLLRGFQADVSDNGSTVAFGPVRRRDSANVERIEVLTGPSGTLFGSGEPGGVINVVTKKPQDGFFVEGRTLFSTLTRVRQEIDINTPLSDTWNTNARFVAALEGTDSFRFRDAFDDRIPESRILLAPSFSFEPTDDLSVVIRGQYLRDDVVFDRGIPIDSGGDAVTDIDAFFGDEEFADFRVRGITADIEIDYALDQNWGLSFSGKFDDDQRDGFSLEPELLSPISFDGPAAGFPIDVVENETVLRQLEERDQSVRTFFGRIDLTGGFETGPLAHDLLVSVDSQNSLSKTGVGQTGIIDAVSIFTPGAPTALDESDLNAPFPVETELNTFSFTVLNKISWGERVHVLGGGRFDYLDQVTRLGSFGSGGIQETAFSPRVGIVVKPLDNLPVSAFFSYGESFTPNVAINEFGDTFDPIEDRTFEGGLRFDLLDGALGLTMTAFDIARRNVPVSTDATFSVESDQESRGVELTLQGAVTPNFNLVANYTYIDSELASVAPGGIEPAIGEPLVGVPNHALSVLGSYRFDEGSLDGLTLTAGLRYRGARLATNTAERSTFGIQDAI